MVRITLSLPVAVCLLAFATTAQARVDPEDAKACARSSQNAQSYIACMEGCGYTARRDRNTVTFEKGPPAPTLLTTAENLFEAVTWLSLNGPRQTLHGWRLIDARGVSTTDDVEIAYDRSFSRVNKFCSQVLTELFHLPKHSACGCTRPEPPWRVVVIMAEPNQHGCVLDRPAIEAHELWHLKGYLGHTPDGQWPSDLKTGRVAPRRMPRPEE